MNSKKSFNGLFLFNEGLAITGKRFVNFIAVFFILLVTFFCVGFSEGSKNYLTKKMDDPYNKWICFDRSLGLKVNELKNLTSTLKEDSIINKFHVEAISLHNYEYQEFLDFENETGSPAKGLELSNKMDLLSTILDSNNINITDSRLLEFLYQDFDNSHGIIVTEKLLRRNGFSVTSPPSFLKFKLKDTNYNNEEFTIAIPLLGVVKELPLSVDFVCNRYSLSYVRKPDPFKSIAYEKYKFLDLEKLDSLVFCSETSDLEHLSFFSEMFLTKLPDSLFWENKFNNFSYYSLKSNSYDSLNLFDLQDLLTQIKGQNYICKDDFSLKNTREFYSDLTVNFISIQLKKLDNISEFKDYLELFPVVNKFEDAAEKELIKINISGIKNKENLNFISHLTYLLTYSLLFFSVFSLILFISSVISSHFEKIKRNIGTLKAFGLSNTILIKNYVIIFFTIIFSSSVLSFVIALILGEMGLSTFIFKSLNISIDDDNCFDLWSSFGLSSFIIVIVSTLIIILYKLRKILSNTPGDLIFER